MYAALFPGQGAQKLGMAASIMESAAVPLLEEASAILGYDIAALAQTGPEEKLQDTRFSQPLIFTITYALWQLRRETLGDPCCFLGHSLGEVTAAAAAGCFTFGDGVQLAARRGEFMSQAYPEGGGMLAVLGLNEDQVDALCEESQDKGWIQAANFNGPGQIVLSGEAAALDKAAELASSLGARRVVRLKVSGPFHSQLMKPAAQELAKHLAQVQIRAPRAPLIANATAAPLVTGEQVAAELVAQLTAPVLWTAAVTAAHELGADELIEFGTHPVVSPFSKRIVKGIKISLA